MLYIPYCSFEMITGHKPSYITDKLKQITIYYKNPFGDKVYEKKFMGEIFCDSFMLKKIMHINTYLLVIDGTIVPDGQKTKVSIAMRFNMATNIALSIILPLSFIVGIIAVSRGITLSSFMFMATPVIAYILYILKFNNEVNESREIIEGILEQNIQDLKD